MYTITENSEKVWQSFVHDSLKPGLAAKAVLCFELIKTKPTQIKSNQIKSRQIKSSQVKSNQIQAAQYRRRKTEKDLWPPMPPTGLPSRVDEGCHLGACKAHGQPTANIMCKYVVVRWERKRN